MTESQPPPAVPRPRRPGPTGVRGRERLEHAARPRADLARPSPDRRGVRSLAGCFVGCFAGDYAWSTHAPLPTVELSHIDTASSPAKPGHQGELDMTPDLPGKKASAVLTGTVHRRR